MVSNKEISEMLAARREGKHLKKDGNHEKVIKNKKCPECGTENKENAKFCVGCGKSFEETPIEIKPEEIKDEPNTKICRSCNSKIPENSKFCGVCGESQHDTTELTLEETVETPEPEEVQKMDTSQFNETPVKLVIRELILTEEGLKFNESSMIEGLNDGNELINYENIEDIDLKEEEGLKTIEIKTPDGSIKIIGVDPDSGSKFVSEAQKMVKEAKPEIDAESMNKIRSAKELLDIGAINEEEFKNIKMKILKKY